MVRLDEDDERQILWAAIVISALAFGFVVGFQTEHAISGAPVALPILVAVCGGFMSAILVLITYDE